MPASARFDVLRRRLSFFLSDHRQGRQSVGKLVRSLSEFGEVAIVGGMLRDMLLKDDYAAFSSDVDLVVDAPDTPRLRSVLISHGAVVNRFGGYALETSWKSDVWQLPKTWARIHGHREVTKVEDLLHTTFFNWDSVIYSTSRKRIFCGPEYLDDLDRRRLDVVLEANPNPLGSCVRTLRSAVRWRAEISPRLAALTADVIESHGARNVVAAEARSFKGRCLLDADIVRDAATVLRTAAFEGRYSKPLAHACPGTYRQSPLPMDVASHVTRAKGSRGGARRSDEQIMQLPSRSGSPSIGPDQRSHLRERA